VTRAGRRIAALLWASSGFALLPGCERPPQHLVVVSLDTLQADRLSAYGHDRPTSPALAELANRGVLFEDAIAQAVSTPPSHASIFTGKNPPRHGLRKLYGQELAPEQLTLAEILKRHGFTTAAFVGAVPLLADRGLDQGFDHYDDRLREGLMERRADETNRRVKRWLASRPAGRLFLWVHYFDPHHPYNAPPPYQVKFAGAQHGPQGPVYPHNRDPDTRREEPGPVPDPADVETMKQLYDAEVRYTDDALAALLGLLAAAGILQDCVIAVVADHGESLGEHGYFFGHWGVLRETARVPMLLVHPDGRHRGRRVEQLVRTVDLMPTLLTWLGIQPPGDLDGVDLGPIATGAPSNLEAYTEKWDYTPLQSLRTQDWLLVHQPARDEAAADATRLYRRDPESSQAEDVGDRHPEIRARLAARLAELRDVADPAAPVQVPVTQEARDQLRALGYLTEE
jgi:arylsulfatase A-like enzyme